MLVVGDLGYGVVDEFAADLPDQFVNAGVSEQAMMSMAAGLASSGYHVFVYSIANFPTLRCLEQIRNDVIYNELNVTIVSVGAGLAYGNLGYTHHAVEDISIMRALPNIRIICPSDPVEAVTSVKACLSHSGPKYVRLGKNGEPRLHNAAEIEHVDDPILLREGNDLVIAATGAIVGECLQAAEGLVATGISAQVWSVPTIKPFPQAWLAGLDLAMPLLTVEEHVRDGGFGSALLEAANDMAWFPTIRRLGLSTDDSAQLGGVGYLRRQREVSCDDIRRAAELLSTSGQLVEEENGQ